MPVQNEFSAGRDACGLSTGLSVDKPRETRRARGPGPTLPKGMGAPCLDSETWSVGCLDKEDAVAKAALKIQVQHIQKG
jgi:hypothetical protein